MSEYRVRTLVTNRKNNTSINDELKKKKKGKRKDKKKKNNEQVHSNITYKKKKNLTVTHSFIQSFLCFIKLFFLTTILFVLK